MHVVINLRFLLLFFHFNENWIFSTDFSRNLSIRNFTSTLLAWAEWVHTDGRTDLLEGGELDIHDETDSRFSRLCEQDALFNRKRMKLFRTQLHSPITCRRSDEMAQNIRRAVTRLKVQLRVAYKELKTWDSDTIHRNKMNVSKREMKIRDAYSILLKWITRRMYCVH